MGSNYIRRLEEVDQNDLDLVGVKGAYLGTLKQLGFNVPRGFVVTSAVYQNFIKSNGVDRLINKHLDSFDRQDYRSVESVSQDIMDHFLAGKIHSAILDEILHSYELLIDEHYYSGDVAVRGSVVSNDFLRGGLAGQIASYLNIAGQEEIINSIKKIWAKLFSPQAIIYRHHHGHRHNQTIAVVIQTMLEPEQSGIMFTIDPLTRDKNTIIIDAIWGLGEALTMGMVEADRYTINKQDLSIRDKSIATQKWKMSRSSNTSHLHHELPASIGAGQKVPTERLMELAQIGQRLENHFQLAQDIEWAIAGDQIYLLETRPITAQSRKIPVMHKDDPKTSQLLRAKALLSGIAGSAGIATGRVKTIHRPSDLSGIEPDDILVAEFFSPDYLSRLDKIKGIVADAGSKTSHAAIIARELGIPAVIGTSNASSVLHDGQVITIDGINGKVFLGKVDLNTHQPDYQSQHKYLDLSGRLPSTTTKIYVNLSNPNSITKALAQSPDGIGLLRSEFVISQLGIHPQAIVDNGREDEFINRLADKVELFARSFYPHPIIYRSSDFKTNEYRALGSGDQYEMEEENPMIGFRGSLRYLNNPQLFDLELRMLKELRGRRGLTNIWLMLPFVRTPEELNQIKSMVDKSGLSAEKRFKLWMMCEVPSNVFLIEDFIRTGIDGISIGTNDLTQLILGADRDNEKLVAVFDERNPAILKAIEIVIDACRKHHLPVSVCGQAVSLYPEFTEFVVNKGVTSVSVDPDAVADTRRLVASIEHQLHRNNH